MGYTRNSSPKRRPYRGSSPLSMGGHVFQRAFLLILVGFFTVYTVVEYLSTRAVLLQCGQLTAGGTTPAPAVEITTSAASSAIPPRTDLEDGHVKGMVVQSAETEEPVEIASEKATKSPAIAKVTMMYGPHARDETMKLIIEGHKQHAARHGHGIHILDRQLLHGLWSKHAWLMMIMLEEMQKPEDMRTKWLAWFDTDIIVMNSQVPLDVFLPPEDGFSHINLLCTNDHNGLNNGAFMIRVSEWGVRYFVDSLALHTYKPDMKLKYSEQSAMEYTITMAKYANKTMLVPQRWFNAYRGPRNDHGRLSRNQKVPENTIMPGDLQLHFAGKKTTKALMPLWVALAANESSGWEMPLSETKLPTEIALFWKLQKEKRDWGSPVQKPKLGESVPRQDRLSPTAQKGEAVKHEVLVQAGADDDMSSLSSATTEGKSSLVDPEAVEVGSPHNDPGGAEA